MQTIKAYFALTKPRVIELLLVATIPAMLQADRGHNHAILIILTLIGGWMGAAAANTFNMIADSDIDKVMKRTERRPLAKMSVTIQQARIFAWSLTIISFLWLWLICGSILGGIFIWLTIAFYIFIYTKWLKRSTPMNVVWGGAAGCMPVMVGWAVIKDQLPEYSLFSWWQAIVLFLVIFFWTPPHTWALAMKYKEDYAAAGVPMMPVVRTPEEVTRQIIGYTWATVITTLLLIPATSWLYSIVSAAAGIWFLIRAYQLHYGVKKGIEVNPLRLFILSNNYLSLVFVALSIDAALGLPTLMSLL